MEESSIRVVEATDIFVGLYWKRFDRVAEQEFSQAQRCQKPCFIYIRDQGIKREKALEEFLQLHIYNPKQGINSNYFDSAVKLGEQVADDIMRWLVRQHREMTAEIQKAQISQDKINRLQAEVNRLQNISRENLPLGTVVDYLAYQMKSWFQTLGYSFESHEILDNDYFEWIINIPARRGYDRILVRGIEGEAEISDIISLNQTVEHCNVNEGWLVTARRISQAARNEVKKQKKFQSVLLYF